MKTVAIRIEGKPQDMMNIVSTLPKGKYEIEIHDSSEVKPGTTKERRPYSKPRANKTWSHEEIQNLKRMHNEGATWRQIATALGRSKAGISSKVYYLQREGRLK